MPDICRNGQFRTRNGRCMNTNPWVQWIKFSGKQGELWPPSATYHAIQDKAGMRRSDVAMTHHNRRVGNDPCNAFASDATVAALGAGFEHRDRRVVNPTAARAAQRVQLTEEAFPVQKHLKVDRMAKYLLGWGTGNPDGRMPARPYMGHSFSIFTLNVLLNCIDIVYFDETFLEKVQTVFGRPLRVDFAPEDDPADAYMYYTAHLNTIFVLRSRMYDRMVLPIVYEEVRHETWLQWTIGILCHELVHVLCFLTCPGPQECKVQNTFHGQQFLRLIKHVFARGAGPGAEQTAPPHAIVLFQDELVTVVAVRDEDEYQGVGLRSKTKTSTFDIKLIQKYQNNGYDVYTIASGNTTCLFAHRQKSDKRKRSKRNKKTHSKQVVRRVRRPLT